MKVARGRASTGILCGWSIETGLLQKEKLEHQSRRNFPRISSTITEVLPKMELKNLTEIKAIHTFPGKTPVVFREECPFV
jgi:hypothetical protein